MYVMTSRMFATNITVSLTAPCSRGTGVMYQREEPPGD